MLASLFTVTNILAYTMTYPFLRIRVRSVNSSITKRPLLIGFANTETRLFRRDGEH